MRRAEGEPIPLINTEYMKALEEFVGGAYRIKLPPTDEFRVDGDLDYENEYAIFESFEDAEEYREIYKEDFRASGWENIKIERIKKQ